MSIYPVDAPVEYLDWISPLPADVKVLTKPARDLPFAHLFVVTTKSFQKQFSHLRTLLAKDGMLWVSWPKKSSKVPTDLDENIIREYGLADGLVDVKVCAVSDVWSGLKFVYRLKDR